MALMSTKSGFSKVLASSVTYLGISNGESGEERDGTERGRDEIRQHTLVERVAEAKMVCLSPEGGRNLIISVTEGRNPMSSITSASSNTSI
jgi:hypothetical protein